jgi:hypothetical protein
MQAEAALAPFDLPADDYVAITPPMSYDSSFAPQLRHRHLPERRRRVG